MSNPKLATAGTGTCSVNYYTWIPQCLVMAPLLPALTRPTSPLLMLAHTFIQPGFRLLKNWVRGFFGSCSVIVATLYLSNDCFHAPVQMFLDCTLFLLIWHFWHSPWTGSYRTFESLYCSVGRIPGFHDKHCSNGGWNHNRFGSGTAGHRHSSCHHHLDDDGSYYDNYDGGLWYAPHILTCWVEHLTWLTRQ